MDVHTFTSRLLQRVRVRQLRRTRAGPKLPPCRLPLESLEDRCTPSLIHVWDGGGTTSNWNEAANWVRNDVPSGDLYSGGNERLIFPAGVAKTTVNMNKDSWGTYFAGLIFHAGYNLTGTNQVRVPSIVVAAGTTTIENPIYSASRLTVNVTTAAASLAIPNLGTISGLTKVGSGKLSLTNGASISGSAMINAGTVVLSGSRLGSLTVVNPRGQLQFDTPGVTFTTPLILNSVAGGVRSPGGHTVISGPVILSGNSRFVVSAGQLDISGAVAGPYGLYKSGAGTLLLSGSNSYSGFTTVIDGALRVENTYGLGGTLVGTMVYPNATLEVGNTSADLTCYEPLNLVGGLTSFGQNTTFKSAVQLIAGASTLPVQVDGSQLTLSGVVSGKAVNLTKLGGGRLVLSGKNTYAASSSQIQEGFVQASHNSAFGLNTNPVVVQDGASLELTNNVTLAYPLTIQGDGADSLGVLHSVSGYNTWVGPITLADASSLGADSGYLTIAGTIKEATGVIGDLTKLGTGILWLTGANSYTGTTQVSSGQLHVLTGTALGTGMEGILVRSQAALGLYKQLTFTVPLILEGQASLLVSTGSSTWNGPIILTGSEAMIITVAGTALTVNGPVMETSSATLNKAGPGTLVLNGQSLLSTSITVSNGTVECNGMVRSPVWVQGSATQAGRLTGRGYLLGAVNVSPYGTLQPGTSAGTGILYTANAVQLSSNSLYVASPGMIADKPTAAQLQVESTMHLGGATLKLNVSGAIPMNVPITIINKISAGKVTGAFAGLSEGTIFTDATSGFKFRITYAGGDGNDVQLTRTA